MLVARQRSNLNDNTTNSQYTPLYYFQASHLIQFNCLALTRAVSQAPKRGGCCSSRHIIVGLLLVVRFVDVAVVVAVVVVVWVVVVVDVVVAIVVAVVAVVVVVGVALVAVAVVVVRLAVVVEMLVWVAVVVVLVLILNLLLVLLLVVVRCLAVDLGWLWQRR